MWNTVRAQALRRWHKVFRRAPHREQCWEQGNEEGRELGQEQGNQQGSKADGQGNGWVNEQ